MWFDLSVYAGKTAVVLIYLFLGLRILGKRQVAQFNLYDLATIIAIANAVQNAMTRGKGDLAVGLVCSGTLLLVGWFITNGLTRVPVAQSAVFGTPTVLLTDGNVWEDRMRRERITHEELELAMRQHGLTEIRQVAIAVLEIDGAISIIPKRAEQ